MFPTLFSAVLVVNAVIRNKAQVLDYLLNKLKEASGDISDAALVNDDGLTIVSTISDKILEERFAAVASSVFRPSRRCCSELELDSFGFAIVSGRQGNLYMKEVGTGHVLAVLIRSSGDWSALQKQLQRAALDLQYIAEMKKRI